VNVPLKWAKGDRCFVRGQVGVVDSVHGECACVKLNEWRNLFVGIEELELVPLAQPSTLPAPPEPLVVGVDVGVAADTTVLTFVQGGQIVAVGELDELDEYLAEQHAAEVFDMPIEEVEEELRAAGVDIPAFEKRVEQFIAEVSAPPAPASKQRRGRPTPALDRSVVSLRKLQTASLAERWSPKRLARAIRDARDASRPVWRRAIVQVFGVGVAELPDTRQLGLFAEVA
jgi:hypothetical protein